jgi:hypothetical protein
VDCRLDLGVAEERKLVVAVGEVVVEAAGNILAVAELVDRRLDLEAVADCKLVQAVGVGVAAAVVGAALAGRRLDLDVVVRILLRVEHTMSSRPVVHTVTIRVPVRQAATAASVVYTNKFRGNSLPFKIPSSDISEVTKATPLMLTPFSPSV